MFDTHAHLNFEVFEKNFDEVIRGSKKSGIDYIVIPGSNIENSKRGVEIAQKYEGVYAAVGIHPFHLYGHLKYHKNLDGDFTELERSLKNSKVVAVGEVGLDRHPYKSRKYPDYEVTEDLITLQKQAFIRQIKLAIKYKKSLIIHHRGAVEELLQILEENWVKGLAGHCVFHLCQADERLLRFAKEKKIYISVGGDVTYDKTKQEFVKKIPLELLVLETDSPYIIPKPLKVTETVNKPQNLNLTAEFLTKLLAVDKTLLSKVTLENSRNLFDLRGIITD